jgi:peroxiredoxin
VLIAVVLLGLLATTGCTTSAGNNTAPGAAVVGRPAPDFTLADLDGNQVSLSDFRGETVFINFWATWCPPCREEMPAIEALYQQYKDKDVVVLGVDILETEGEVRQFVEEGDYSWTFVLDTTGEVTASYQVAAIPTSFFIDKEGIIRTIQIGAMTKGAMEARLLAAME